MSYHIDQAAVVQAPIELIFNLISDPTQMHKIDPDIAVVAHSPSPLGGHDTDWEFHYGAIKLSGHSQVVAYEPPTRLVVDTHGGIPSHWVWHFEAAGSGTRVNVSLDYEVPGPLQFMGQLLVKRNRQAVETQMANLKRIAEM